MPCDLPATDEPAPGSELCAPPAAGRPDSTAPAPETGRDKIAAVAFAEIETAEIPPGPTEPAALSLSAGHRCSTVMRWGDPLVVGAPEFDPFNQSRESQERQFGYGGSCIGFFPLPHPTTARPVRALLVVSHPQTDPAVMFPGYFAGRPARWQVDAELAAGGLSIVEVWRDADGDWSRPAESRHHRRVTGFSWFELAGPAAGHASLTTGCDPTGFRVRGTLHNRTGGATPWATALSCEEDFRRCFGNIGRLAEDDPRRARHLRFGLPAGPGPRRWENFHDRFDGAIEPNEPFRFGWIVELDPYDLTGLPRKRTALGRFQHAGAAALIARNGRAVVYSADGADGGRLYKFVSTGRYHPRDRRANLELLDEGTLFAARLHADGGGEWLPLEFGCGPLSPANGFESPADVLIDARHAAGLVGATRLARPRDVGLNPITGAVGVLLATRFGPGQLLELTETADNAAGLTFRWQAQPLAPEPVGPGPDFCELDHWWLETRPVPERLVFDFTGNAWLGISAAEHETPGGPANASPGIFVFTASSRPAEALHEFSVCAPGWRLDGLNFAADFETMFCGLSPAGRFAALAPEPGDRAGWPRPGLVAIRNTAFPPQPLPLWNSLWPEITPLLEHP